MFLLKYKFYDPENCLIDPMQKVEGMGDKIDELEGLCQQILGKVDNISTRLSNLQQTCFPSERSAVSQDSLEIQEDVPSEGV